MAEAREEEPRVLLQKGERAMDILLVSVEYFDLYCNPQLSKKKKKTREVFFRYF